MNKKEIKYLLIPSIKNPLLNEAQAKFKEEEKKYV